MNSSADAPVPKPNAPRLRVLFVCTLNTLRSPMAHALARALLANTVRSESAGVYRTDPVDPMAVATMREIGLDITDHHPHTLADLEASGDDLGAYDLIIALSEAARDAAESLAADAGVSLEQWPIDDPSAVDGSDPQRLQAYRYTRDSIRKRLLDRFAEGVDRD